MKNGGKKMGTFRIDVEIADFRERNPRWKHLKGVLVDTGSEYTWLPKVELQQMGVIPFRERNFRMANGQIVTREIGAVYIRSGPFIGVEEVVLAQPGDMMLLGAHTLEGWCATVDPANKRLIDSGPAPAALAA